MPLNSAIDGGSPALTASAVTTPVKAIVDPTARSIPPLMMINVIPIAPIATITVCERTMRRLLGESRRDGVSTSSEKTPITSTKPSTGPSRFSHRFTRVNTDYFRY
jgi:hypothetical protein